MKASHLSDRANAQITDSSVEVWLHSYHTTKKDLIREEHFAQDQLLLAVEIKPKRIRKKWQNKSAIEVCGVA